jgi:hypothetical protein
MPPDVLVSRCVKIERPERFSPIIQERGNRAGIAGAIMGNLVGLRFWRAFLAATLTAATLSLCAASLPAQAITPLSDSTNGIGGSASNGSDAIGSTRAVGEATLAQLAGGGSGAIERGHVQAALVAAQARLEPDTAVWTDGPGDEVPGSSARFSVAFDNGRGSPSGLPDSFGTRVAILTVSGTGYAGTVATLAGELSSCALPPGIATAAALLAAVGSNMACPSLPITTPPVSAITSLWAWGNSVDPAVDARGRGQSGMLPAAIAQFAADHGLSTVYLSVPWASDQGAIAPWLSDSVDALHARGIRVAALGGDASWLATPGLVAQWVTAARAAADFDAVQLDVEPWAGVVDPDFSAITPQFLDLLSAARTAAGPLPLGIDLPWWLTTKQFGAQSVFGALIGGVDSVAIVAFSDHAAGPDGIVALASPTVALASAAGRDFTVGVETDSPQVAGGSQYTFFDEGPATLEAESAAVRDAFGSVPGYAGVTVEHLLAWTALIG